MTNEPTSTELVTADRPEGGLVTIDDRLLDIQVYANRLIDVRQRYVVDRLVKTIERSLEEEHFKPDAAVKGLNLLGSEVGLFRAANKGPSKMAVEEAREFAFTQFRNLLLSDRSLLIKFAYTLKQHPQLVEQIQVIWSSAHANPEPLDNEPE